LKQTRFILALSTVALLGLAATAGAQKKSGAETGLIGIKLYDSGIRVVSIFGTPDEIQAVGTGGGSNPGPGGGAGPRGPGAAGGGGKFAPAGAGGAVGYANPMPFGDEMLRFQSSGSVGLNTPPSGNPSPGTGPGGGGGGGGMGSSERVQFTRWVYNRSGSKYGFVLDKFNRVVQIEAIGLQNAKVKTRRGVGFGSTFAQIIKKYQAPDGYEVSGDTIVVRYLLKNKCAFRLSRLGPNKPQVVTGVVVAAGKM